MRNEALKRKYFCGSFTSHNSFESTVNRFLIQNIWLFSWECSHLWKDSNIEHPAPSTHTPAITSWLCFFFCLFPTFRMCLVFGVWCLVFCVQCAPFGIWFNFCTQQMQTQNEQNNVLLYFLLLFVMNHIKLSNHENHVMFVCLNFVTIFVHCTYIYNAWCMTIMSGQHLERMLEYNHEKNVVFEITHQAI